MVRKSPVRDRPPPRVPAPLGRSAIGLTLAFMLVLACASAQTFSVGVLGVTGTAGPVRLELGVEGAQVGATSVSLAIAFDGDVQLDLALSGNESFGPIGNVIFEGRAAVRTDGTAAGAVGARGVLGPLALGVTLSAFGADPARFAPLAIGSDQRPAFGRAGGASGGWGVALRASGRPSRDLIIEAAPAYYATADGGAWRLDGRIRWIRAIGANELSLRWYGSVAPGGASAAGAVGAGFTVERRRAPDLDFAAYVGVSREGWRPGLTAELSENLGAGVSARLGLALEPYRIDVAPYRLRFGMTLPTGLGEASLAAAASAGGAPPALALRVGMTLPVRLAAAAP